MVDWKKLEDDVYRTIEKGCPIDDFESKELKECKYIQKIAEDKLTVLERHVNLIIFIGAVAVSLVISFIFTRERGWIEFFAYFIAIIILIGGIYWGHYLRPQNKRCRRIILDAEQRILSEEREPNQAQEITTTPQRIQERTEPLAETKERKYPDIWELYITVAVFFFTIYPVARDYVEKPESFSAVLGLSVTWLLIFMSGAIAGQLIFNWLRKRM